MSHHRTIVVVGAHGTGKSTLGARLARALGVPFHAELGRILATGYGLRPAGADATSPQAAFDEAVFRGELLRDVSWDGRGARVVETWHPGNLAYASLRSPGIAQQWLGAVLESVRDAGALVLPLVASPETLARRRSLPEAPAFFSEVARRTLAWGGELGLPCTAPISTDHGGPDAALRAALERLEEAGGPCVRAARATASLGEEELP